MHYSDPPTGLPTSDRATYLPVVLMNDKRYFFVSDPDHHNEWQAGSSHLVCEHKDAEDGHLSFYAHNEDGRHELYLADGFRVLTTP